MTFELLWHNSLQIQMRLSELSEDPLWGCFRGSSSISSLGLFSAPRASNMSPVELHLSADCAHDGQSMRRFTFVL